MPELDEIVAIDDGSTDGGFYGIEHSGVRLIRIECNGGRGAARARALNETSGDFLLSVDGTKALAPNFLVGALSHMEDSSVAAVNGRNWQSNSETAADRWRGRHLFKMDYLSGVKRNAGLNTNGVLLRRSAVEEVGGFDLTRRHSEDAELGSRLNRAGYKVLFDPKLVVEENACNSWRQVFERQWRYNVGLRDQFSVRSWLMFVRQSWAVMLPRDWRLSDWKCAFASLVFPLVLLVFWNSWSLSIPKKTETSGS